MSKNKGQELNYIMFYLFFNFYDHIRCQKAIIQQAPLRIHCLQAFRINTEIEENILIISMLCRVDGLQSEFNNQIEISWINFNHRFFVEIPTKIVSSIKSRNGSKIYKSSEMLTLMAADWLATIMAWIWKGKKHFSFITKSLFFLSFFEFSNQNKWIEITGIS